MADSIRRQMLAALKALLKTILVVNEYKTNIGNNITLQRSTNLQSTEVPSAIIIAGSETKEEKGTHRCTLAIEIELKAFGSTPATDIEDAISDVIKAIGTTIGTDVSIGALSQHTTPVNAGPVDLDQNNKKIAGVVLEFTVQYITGPWSPDALAL